MTDRWTSVGTFYLGFYWVFHFGIIGSVALGYSPRLFNATDATWATVAQLAQASIPAALFLVLCATSYASLVRGALETSDDPEGIGDPTAPSVLDGAAVVGFLVLVAGLGLWAQIFLGSGARFGGGYIEFLARTKGTLTPYAYLFISVGMGLVGAARHRTLSRLAVIAFVVWSAPAFFLGLRGEVLIPLFAFVIARSRSGRLTVRRTWVVMAGIVALAAGSLVRVMRVGGTPDIQSLNPINGLVELGYSIRPMIHVQEVHDGAGGPFTGLATYLAPLERLIGARLLGRQLEPASTDQDVFSTFIATTFGPIGGSVSAEAYRSSALLGVCVVAIILGGVLAALDSIPSSVTVDATVGMVASVLLLWTRNDFTPVPLSLVIVAALLFITHLIPGDMDAKRQGHGSLRATRGRGREKPGQSVSKEGPQRQTLEL
jgi:hypothetical protein